jgi:hypothetical protein
MDDYVLPECFLDTNLMETLLPPQKSYNHQTGCNNVIRLMQKKFIGKFALGILDMDKDSPDKLQAKKFDFINEMHSVRLYKHQLENHYLILHPNIEKWLINEAKQVNLSLEYYQLSSDFEELKKLAKPATSKNNPRFKAVFEKLKEQNANGITQLFNWAAYLMNNADQIDETLLKNIGNAPS